MLAAIAVSQSADDPLSGLVLRDVPTPTPQPGWVVVRTLEATGTRPVVDCTLPLAEIHKGFQLMADGVLTGKVVIHPPTSDDRGMP